MPRQNTIEAAKLSDWINKESVLYATDTRNGKHLSMRIRVADAAAIITLGDKVIFEGRDLEAAAEAFNDAW